MTLITKILLAYYLLANIVLFVSMALDKGFAKKDKRRIPESTLFIMALLGGSIGGFGGMFAFRHKNRKIHFYIIYAIAFILHAALLYLIFTKIL